MQIRGNMKEHTQIHHSKFVDKFALENEFCDLFIIKSKYFHLNDQSISLHNHQNVPFIQLIIYENNNY